MPKKTTRSIDQAVDLIAGECLAVRTRLLNRTITGIYDDALRPHGVTVGQLNILVFVAKRGPLPAGDVARRLNMEKSTVSRNVRLMRENGWLDVESEGSGHGRDLSLTEKGEALVEESLPAWKEAQTRAKAVLGQQGAASIHSVGDAVWSHIGRG
ncbi:MAG: MarR family winged helix-turn-helix transcriptional regulator [Longimicrobiales bacterium]